MHNTKVELQGKCRRFFYAKVDGPPSVDEDGNPIPDSFQHVAGDILGTASGGGALEKLRGDDLIIATFNDSTAPERIGCVEEYFSPIPQHYTIRSTRTGNCYCWVMCKCCISHI